jgi:hypothetical protein
MSDQEKLLVDDCIVLGQAVPDEISDSRHTVCTAGYSPKHGLLRLYPIPPGADMDRWNIMEIPLERYDRDSRKESWKVQGSKAEWDRLTSKMRVIGQIKQKSAKMKLLDELFDQFGVQCVDDLNERKLSLGFVRPTILGYNFEKRDTYDPTKQMKLDSTETFWTIHNYRDRPRVQYRCSGCKKKHGHDQQILEWGVYEWMRKHPDNIEEVWKILGFNDPSWNIAGFLVGNHFAYRNSFMVISVFRFKKTGK